MMKKVVILLILVLMAGCNRGEIAETAVPPVVESAKVNSTNEIGTAVANPTDTITLRMIVYDWESGSYRNLIEAFEAENPGIEIKLVSLEETLGLDSAGKGQWPDDAAERLVSAADVVSTSAIGISNGASGLLLDLRPLIEGNTTFDEADFYPNALEYFKSDGGVWGLPNSLTFDLIFYNKDAFDAAGHAYPQPGWSWGDLLTAAQATTVREKDEVTRWGLVQLSRSPFIFILPRTGPLIDTMTNPPTVQFDRPDVADALQWYVDLFLLHEVTPNLEAPEPDKNGVIFLSEYALIEDGKAAMWSESSGSWPWRSQQINVGVAPFPVDAPEDRTTPVYINGYALSAGTRHPEAAWRWIKFLSQQPSASFGLDTALPARRSVAQASGFWDRVDPELGDTLRYVLDHSYFFRFGAGNSAFYEAVDAVLTQNRPVADALADAQVQAEMEIADIAARQEKADAVEIVVSEPGDAALPERAVSIVFTTVGDIDGLTPYRNLVKTFQEQNPDVVIELKTPDFNAGSIYLRDLAANSDCLLWYGGVIREEGRATVLNLDPFLDADPELDKEDFYPQALDAFSYQGQLWGLPGGMNVTLIMYNKALFDEAGIPYPQDNWTMDDFLATAVALTAGDDPETKQYGYVPQESELNDLTAFLERLDAQFFDDSVDPPQLTFTHPDTVKAMRWFTALTTEFGVKPAFMTNIAAVSVNIGQERKTLIEDGRAAMWSYQGYQSFPEINIDDLDVGVIPLPVGPNRTATVGSVITGYVISSGTEQEQVCWEWIKFLSEQSYLTNVGNTLPARRSVAESAMYAQTAGAELAAANLAAVTGQTGLSFNMRLNRKAGWLENGALWWLSYAYDQILSNGVPVEEALAVVQAKADAYRDCVIVRDVLDSLNGQRDCLRQVDDTIPDFFGDGVSEE